MLELTDFRRMHAWALKDNGDVKIVGWNFTQHRDNDHFLWGTDRALLTAIERSERLSRLFLVEDEQAAGDFIWRESALASYEATA